LTFDRRIPYSRCSFIDVVHPCGENLAWHKDAVVWIQRIQVCGDHYASANEADGPVGHKKAG